MSGLKSSSEPSTQIDLQQLERDMYSDRGEVPALTALKVLAPRFVFKEGDEFEGKQRLTVSQPLIPGDLYSEFNKPLHEVLEVLDLALERLGFSRTGGAITVADDNGISHAKSYFLGNLDVLRQAGVAVESSPDMAKRNPIEKIVGEGPQRRGRAPVK